jgi:hypothetical protein
VSESDKDRDDVREVMTAQRDVLDWEYIQSWTGRHGTTELLHKIRSSIPAR